MLKGSQSVLHEDQELTQAEEEALKAKSVEEVIKACLSQFCCHYNQLFITWHFIHFQLDGVSKLD